MEKSYYLKLREKYHPSKLNLIFLLESPPVSGKYFYDENGRKSEPLFMELMKLIGYSPIAKKDGLEYFKRKGYLLVDATYKPVNNLKGKLRDETILSDFDTLLSDLNGLCQGKDIPIVLVKANICRMLDERLTAKGFNVVNKGAIIPFPSTGQQKRFHSAISEVLKF